MRPGNQEVAGERRREGRTWLIAAAFLTGLLTALTFAACGGTTGQEGLPASPNDGAALDVTVATETGLGDAGGGGDATLGADAGPDAGDNGAFDVAIQYADQILPDITAPPMDDAGMDAGPSLLEAAPDPACAPNNEGGACTPTEELFVQHGGAGDGGCYECLVGFGCLDDSLFASDIGHECGDLLPNTRTLTGGDPYAACLSTIQCVLGSGCATQAIQSACFCGTAAGTACLTTGAANGPCRDIIANGLNLAVTDPTSILKAYTDTVRPSGVVLTIFSCAASNGCAACFPPVSE